MADVSNTSDALGTLFSGGQSAGGEMHYNSIANEYAAQQRENNEAMQELYVILFWVAVALVILFANRRKVAAAWHTSTAGFKLPQQRACAILTVLSVAALVYFFSLDENPLKATWACYAQSHTRWCGDAYDAQHGITLLLLLSTLGLFWPYTYGKVLVWVKGKPEK